MFMILLSASCVNKDKKIVKEWVGQEVYMAENFPLILASSEDTTLYSGEKKATVLLITDSLQCAPCQLKLDKWYDLINEYGSDVRFTFVVYPRTRIQLLARCKAMGFHYPLCIDVKNEMETKNHFSKDLFYRCFLLDANNKVLLVGNPMYNEKLLDLYKQTIQQIVNDELKTQ